MHGVDSSGDGTDEDGMRVEWCKARAHTMHWAKEVELLYEEMGHVLRFFRWQATWWDEQGVLRTLWSPFLSSSPDAVALSTIVLSGVDYPADLPDLSALRPPEI
ncbi:hypothetical protein CY34DRAFT_14197 [Suillus luteus UH-Slu-Lm8-n1]|uniref:Uncharacterized protein n=1 Tax=Suillus luteus UH-Slu-Lm8-n1 TaxID=930992 RepID=A0A0D0ANW5_9AGAM|nr:hypothetical protein CY34DRAFT_14197 [Suillus luteus UH-Slu-Lm8-n1]